MNDTNNSTGPYYQVSQTVISSITEALWTAYMLLLVVWLILLRKSPRIRARGVIPLFTILVLYSVLVIVSNVRYIVGREKFPCFLHFAGYAFAPVGVIANVYKTYRLILVFLQSKYQAQETVKFYRIVKRLQSPIVLLLPFVFVVLIHVAILIINMTAFPVDTNSCSFVNQEGFAKYWIALQLVIPAGAYSLLYVALTIFMLAKKISDTWGIRIECFAAPIAWIPFLAIWLFGYLTTAPKIWPEQYFSVINFIYMAAAVDLLVTYLIPLILATIDMRKQQPRDEEMQQPKNEVETILFDPKGYALFLDFTVASFCPEQLLFWATVKNKFEKHPTQEVARELINNFILPNSINELNLDGKAKNEYLKEIQQKMDSVEKDQLPSDLFIKFVKHAELDMLDSLSRFKNTKAYKDFIATKK